MSKKYHRGTLEEFNTWHDSAKISANIPHEGKINAISGIPAPDNQRTIAAASAISHPTNQNDYIWIFSHYEDTQRPKFSLEEVKTEGFLPSTIFMT